MSRPIPLDALGQWLVDQVGDAGPEVAVLAGHFAIFSAGGEALDLLEADGSPVAGAREMLDFTRVTWDAACQTAGSRARFVLLVDDVQFVRPQLNDRTLSERLAAELAANYRAAVPRLPAYHGRQLAIHGIADTRVMPASEEQWIFSERQLRVESVRHLRQQIVADGGSAGLARSADGNTMNVTLADGGDYCLIHSGRTSCAGGYIELLWRLHARGIRKLIAMVPMRCLGQIAVGSALVRQLYGLHDFAVVNVAVPDPGVGLPAHVVGGVG